MQINRGVRIACAFYFDALLASRCSVVRINATYHEVGIRAERKVISAVHVVF